MDSARGAEAPNAPPPPKSATESNLAETVIFIVLAAIALVFHLKPHKIIQFIHNFPFGEIILLTDLYFYDCEIEPFRTNQVDLYCSIPES